VRLWARPDQPIAGKIREVSPVADPATRTYTGEGRDPGQRRRPPGHDRLGAVHLDDGAAADQGAADRAVPEKNATAVWVIENGAVRLAPVTTGGVAGNDVVLTGGVKAGQTIVTAGVQPAEDRARK
jgi:multidrug efflux system membrane fusion protein